LAPQIITIIYGKYYAGNKMRGTVDKHFKDKINGNFLCLISAAICHTLRAWQTGTYVEPRDFKRETSLGMLQVPQRTRLIADTGKDLLQRQRRTWGNIPGNLREKILQHIRNAVQDHITQNHGPEKEITIGYEDDHEALEAELNALETGRNWNGRTTHESWTTKVATGKARVIRSPAKGVRGLGEEDISESQEHWYIAEEGKTNEESDLENAESLTADAEEADGSCVVGGNMAGISSKE
jgi:hypothetical protein